MDDRSTQNAKYIQTAGAAAVCVVFAAMLAFFFVVFAFGENREFSDIENRELAKAPQLIVDGEINREFYQGLERFFSDAFPFRDAFLLANRKIQGFYTAARLPEIGADGDEDAVVFFDRTSGGSPANAAEQDPAAPPEREQKPPTGQSAPAQTSSSSAPPSSSGSQGSSETPDPASAQTEDPTAAQTAAPTDDPAQAQAHTPTPTHTPAPPTEPAPTPSEQVRDFGGTGVALVNNQAIELFDYSEERTLAYAALVDDLAAKSGVPTYVVTPPCAAELYLPDRYRTASSYQRPAFDLLESTLKNASFVNFFDEFHQEKENYVYFRSDHHWTADGAYIAYKNFAEAAGFEPTDKAALSGGNLEGFLGSLYRQIYLEARSQILESEPDSVRYYEPLFESTVLKYDTAQMTDGVFDAVIKPEGLNETNLYNVFFGGDIRLLFMQSAAGRGKSVMVVRDSYGHAFLPFLANNYERVYAVEPRYFDEFPLTDFIAEHEIDELVFLNHSLSATSSYWLNWVDELKKLK